MHNPPRNAFAVQCAYLQRSLEAAQVEYASQSKALIEYGKAHDALLAEVQGLRATLAAKPL